MLANVSNFLVLLLRKDMIELLYFVIYFSVETEYLRKKLSKLEFLTEFLKATAWNRKNLPHLNSNHLELNESHLLEKCNKNVRLQIAPISMPTSVTLLCLK